MTYAVGRTLTYADMPSVRVAVRQAQAKDGRFSELVLAVVRSPEFQMREKKAAPPLAATKVAVNGKTGSAQ